ncbi:MAG: dTDP-4-dehydrorhamnose 3,5-epimerase [Leptospiraceae bacterium]|nr:dTDP-4-dehydrorhamnose 3,5-epimerase [Leptospiraceae bacterium]
MNWIKTEFPGLCVLEPKIFKDDRGFFFESYSEKIFSENGESYTFIQDNHAKNSDPNTIRGLHFQKPPYAQTKLVRVIRGAIYDVVVDLRKSSPTFKKWYGIELNSLQHNQLLVPKGFAHGYLVLKPETEVLYKVDQVYNPESESGIIWNDPELSIDWFVNSPILSPKDSKLGLLKESIDIFE